MYVNVYFGFLSQKRQKWQILMLYIEVEIEKLLLLLWRKIKGWPMDGSGDDALTVSIGKFL